MDIVSLAIWVIVVIAVIAVVYWFTRASGVVIPQPLLIVLYAVIAIVAIIFLARIAGLGRV